MSFPALRWQFDMTWELFEFHLEKLGDADCFWEPAQPCWTVREGEDGWRADFAASEPDPVPAATIAWVTWHIGWWWYSALAAVDGKPPYQPEEVIWPGDAASTRGWLRTARTKWIAYLDGLDAAALAKVAPFPWQDEEYTVAHLVAWVNAELMKNVAEIGQLRMQRALA